MSPFYNEKILNDICSHTIGSHILHIGQHIAWNNEPMAPNAFFVCLLFVCLLVDLFICWFVYFKGANSCQEMKDVQKKISPTSRDETQSKTGFHPGHRKNTQLCWNYMPYILCESQLPIFKNGWDIDDFLFCLTSKCLIYNQTTHMEHVLPVMMWPFEPYRETSMDPTSTPACHPPPLKIW